MGALKKPLITVHLPGDSSQEACKAAEEAIAPVVERLGAEMLVSAGVQVEIHQDLSGIAASVAALAQAIEHQAAAIAALVDEIAAHAENEPEDNGIPQAMSTKR